MELHLIIAWRFANGSTTGSQIDGSDEEDLLSGQPDSLTWPAQIFFYGVTLSQFYTKPRPKTLQICGNELRRNVDQFREPYFRKCEKNSKAGCITVWTEMANISNTYYEVSKIAYESENYVAFHVYNNNYLKVQ